jgi:hypothetical protein
MWWGEVMGCLGLPARSAQAQQIEMLTIALMAIICATGTCVPYTTVFRQCSLLHIGVIPIF